MAEEISGDTTKTIADRARFSLGVLLTTALALIATPHPIPLKVVERDREDIARLDDLASITREAIDEAVAKAILPGTPSQLVLGDPDDPSQIIELRYPNDRRTIVDVLCSGLLSTVAARREDDDDAKTFQSPRNAGEVFAIVEALKALPNPSIRSMKGPIRLQKEEGDRETRTRPRLQPVSLRHSTDKPSDSSQVGHATLIRAFASKATNLNSLRFELGKSPWSSVSVIAVRGQYATIDATPYLPKELRTSIKTLERVVGLTGTQDLAAMAKALGDAEIKARQHNETPTSLMDVDLKPGQAHFLGLVLLALFYASLRGQLLRLASGAKAEDLCQSAFLPLFPDPATRWASRLIVVIPGLTGLYSLTVVVSAAGENTTIAATIAVFIAIAWATGSALDQTVKLQKKARSTPASPTPTATPRR